MNYILSNLHFILIHFPIALLIISLLFDLITTFYKRSNLHHAGLITLVIGTLGAIASVLTGPENERNPLFPRHELFGKITMIFFIILCLVRLVLYVYRKREIGRNPVYLAAALVGVILLSYTGHLGGQMVHRDPKSLKPGQQLQQPGQGQGQGQSPQDTPIGAGTSK
jgi:uncharacterized membrane protein